MLGITCILLVFISFLLLKRFKAELIFEGIKEKKFYGSGVDSIVGYKKAIKGLDTAIALNPLSSGYLCKKADLLADLANHKDLASGLIILDEFGSRDKMLVSAGNFYQKAIDLNPSRADYHLRLGWLYTVLNRQPLAYEEFKKASILDPQNEEIKSYINKYLNEEGI